MCLKHVGGVLQVLGYIKKVFIYSITISRISTYCDRVWKVTTAINGGLLYHNLASIKPLVWRPDKLSKRIF